MSIGIFQIILILAIVFLLFGAGKIPRLMGDLARGLKIFKKEIKDVELDNQANSSVSKSTDTNINNKSKGE